MNCGGVVGAGVIAKEDMGNGADGSALQPARGGQGLAPVVAAEILAGGADIGEVAHVHAHRLAVLAGATAMKLCWPTQRGKYQGFYAVFIWLEKN